MVRLHCSMMGTADGRMVTSSLALILGSETKYTSNSHKISANNCPTNSSLRFRGELGREKRLHKEYCFTILGDIEKVTQKKPKTAEH